MKSSITSRSTAAFRLCVLALALCSAFAGCDSDREVSRENVGKIVDANVVPTSFNESIKTQVKTEKRFFVVIGTPDLQLGEEAQIVTFADGRKYLAWPSGKYMAAIR